MATDDFQANGDFLGTGWSFPPTFFESNYGVQMVSDSEDIRQSLWLLFSTRQGERVMVPLYGTGLWKNTFRSITTTMMSQIQTMVRQAILNWEPRITVVTVQVQQDADVEGLLLISVTYTIRKTNTRSNMVYPFYLLEATIPAKAP